MSENAVKLNSGAYLPLDLVDKSPSGLKILRKPVTAGKLSCIRK